MSDNFQYTKSLSIRSALLYLVLSMMLWGCRIQSPEQQIPEQYLMVLGVAQDAGYPQAGCELNCCLPYWEGKEKKRMAVSLGIVDRLENQSWMIEATPDFKDQLHLLSDGDQPSLKGIFLTHAHIGHYIGLAHLGREVMGAQALPVYAMPRMGKFLQENGPWEQLVTLENIKIKPLKNDSTIHLNNRLSITPLLVPHRDEYSETVGYIIQGPNQKVLFIPDINKWELWQKDIMAEIKDVDLALLDGSFYQNGELPNRDMSEIPHPFIEESMQLFSTLSSKDKAKIHFIHFNHTNPVLREGVERMEVLEQGFQVAQEGSVSIL